MSSHYLNQCWLIIKGSYVIHLRPLLQEMHTKSICITSLQITLYFHICKLMNRCIAANLYLCFITGLEQSSPWFTMLGFYSHVCKCQTKFCIHREKSKIVILPYEEIICLPVNIIQHCWKVLDYFLGFQRWLLSSQLSYMFLTSLSKHRWEYEAHVGDTISFLPQYGSITERLKTFILPVSLPATIQDLYFLLSNNEPWTELSTWYKWHLKFCQRKYWYFDSMLGDFLFQTGPICNESSLVHVMHWWWRDNKP